MMYTVSMFDDSILMKGNNVTMHILGFLTCMSMFLVFVGFFAPRGDFPDWFKIVFLAASGWLLWMMVYGVISLAGYIF